MAKKPTNNNDAAWENISGESYGGQSEILELKPGEMAGPIEYRGFKQITLDTGLHNSHQGIIDGELMRLPLAATFTQALDQADVQIGDVFHMRRTDDVEKKRGAGKGKPMAIYEIKIVKRGQRHNEEE